MFESANGVFGQIVNWIGGMLRWWIEVAPWEQAVRVRLGKHVSLLGPGIHLRIPLIDRFYREGTRLRTIDTGIQTASTADNHAVTIRGRIRFRVDNYLTVFQTLHHAEDTLIDLAMSEIAVQVRNHDRADLTPLIIEAAVTGALNHGKYGLADLGVSITDFAFVRTFRLIQGDNRYDKGQGMHYVEADR